MLSLSVPLIGPSRRLMASGVASVRRLDTLVSASWLAERMKSADDKLKVVHASWNGCKDYAAGHIPGAVCFDGEYCRDRTSPYKNMLPKPEDFSKYVGATLGVDNDTDVVVYDSNAAAPLFMHAVRVWYMFRVFGHDRVALLNGGLRRWIEEGGPVTDRMTPVSPKTFTDGFRPELVLSYEQVLEKVVRRSDIQLVDARSPERYRGVGEDPYGKAGHIPNSLNVHCLSLLDPETKLVKESDQLKRAFEDSGVTFARPMATTCGAGMTATAVAFAAFLLGNTNVPVYDGSWCEWNRRAPDEHIVKG